jgi:type III secretion protein U
MSGEKTEHPTHKKIQDARKKGQVCTSKEVISTALILSLVAMLMGFSEYYMEHFGNLMFLPESFIDLPFKQALNLILENLVKELFMLCVPSLAITVFVVIAAHMAQFGLLFSTESITPDIKKINPVEGAKKIISIKSLIEFIKSILKVALLSVIVWVTLEHNLKSLIMLPGCGMTCIVPVTGLMLQHLMLMCAAGFIIIAAADYGLSRYQYHKQLRMSKDEVKRERKEMDGSPEIKCKRRELHKELQSNSMRADVKRSSVIVANPYHIAIGIRYKKDETPLPIVTLKYTDALALQVRKMAEEEGIPVLERIPLARALHRDGMVDQYIPADQIQTTAEVLRWLQSQSKDR